MQQFLESTPSAMLLVAEDGRIVLVNSQAEQMFHYPREQMVGETVERLIPEGLRPQHVRHRQTYMVNPQPRPMGKGRDLRARRKDGHEFAVEVGLSPMTTSGGTYIVTTIIDISERKHVEDLFHQLFQFSPDGTVVADHTGQIVLVNTRAEEMFGYTSEELIGQPVEILVPTHMRQKHSADVKNYCDHPRVRRMETTGRFSARRKDGSEFPVEISLAPVRTDRGLMVFSSIRDVTEHRRLMREIAGNLELQRATAEILRMSLAPLPLATLLERALELLLAVPWLGAEAGGSILLVDNDDPDVLVLEAHQGLSAALVQRCQRVSVGECLYGTAAARGETVFAPHAGQRGQQSVLDMPQHGHYAVPLLTENRVLGILSVYIPPSYRHRAEHEEFLSATADLLAGLVKRKRAEVAQQNSEERFELAVQGTNAGIWDWDLRTNRVYFSPRWKSMLGYGPDEISSDFDEWKSRLHPDDRERALEVVQKYLDGRSKEYELEHRLRHKDGSYRWILSRGAAVFDDQGRAYRMVGSQLDITRRRNAEARLRENQAELLAAQQIQQRLLPQAPPQVPGLDIAGACFPAEYTAGDYFDYLSLPDGSVGVVIADVMGHGIGPAMLTATTSAHMRSLAAAKLPLTQMVGQTNVMLYDRNEGEQFVTLLICGFDPATGVLRYVNAGHPAGFVIDAAGAVKAELGDNHMALGIVRDVDYREGESSELAPGDTLLLLTDGLLEAQAPDRAFYGIERALDLVSTHRDRSARQLIGLLRRDVVSFTGQETLRDDLTLVVAKVQSLAGDA
jgi:PAS domain S-box-containing protein